jgi:ribosome modulation factor
MGEFHETAEQGYKACKAGESVKKNPYDLETRLRDFWDYGFHIAHMEGKSNNV